MQNPPTILKSTNFCTTCGHQLKECTCICQKHPCCNGGVFVEGHLADCPLFGVKNEQLTQLNKRLPDD